MRSLKMREVDRSQPKGKRHWLARVAPAAALMLLAAKPAWAGQWEEVPLPPVDGSGYDAPFLAELAKRYKGTVHHLATEGVTNWPSVPQVTRPDETLTAAQMGAWGSFYQDRWSTMGGRALADVRLERRSIFRWVPDRYYQGDPGAEDKPPEFLYLKVTTMACATADRYSRPNYLNEVGSATVSAAADGRAATPTEATWPTYGGQDDLSSQAFCPPESKLYKIPVPAGATEVVGPWVPLQATAEISGERSYRYSTSTSPNPLHGDITASVGYNVAIDTRGVQINSSIGQTYRKGADTGVSDNEGPVYARVANLRKPDGSITVDVVADWLEAGNVFTTCQMEEWYKRPSFAAQISGTWVSPSYAWSSPSGFYDNGRGTDSMTPVPETWVPQSIFGSPCASGFRLGGIRFPRKSSDLPKPSSVVTLQVTDSDGAVGSATYAINWHLPFEEQHKVAPGDDKYSYSDPVGNPGALGTLPAVVRYTTKNQRSVWWTVAEGGTGIASNGTGVVGLLWPELASGAAISTGAGIALAAANFAIAEGAPEDESEKDEDFTYARYCEALDKQIQKRDALASTDPVVQQNASQWPDFFPDERVTVASQSRDAARPAPGQAPVQENDTFFTTTRSTMFGNFVWQTTTAVDVWRRDHYSNEGYVRTKDDTIKYDKGHDLRAKVVFG